MKHKGILIVVSGFSGAGKGTVMKELINRYPNYALSVSMTTRKPREGEKDGVSYFFVDKAKFEDTIAAEGLIEYAQYCENYYGTPRAYVEEQMDAGKDVILEIEIQGALKVKEKFPDALLVFIMPPSAQELRRRLTARGTETQEVIDARMTRAAEEAEGIEAYDLLIVNDDLEECVEHMHSLIRAAHYRPDRNEAFIENMKEELIALVKGEK